MKYVAIIVILLLILMFTFLLKRVRNPITNLHLYYKDCTICPRAFDLINTIFTNYHFIQYYSIYIFKTNEIPKLGKSYSFYAYTIQTNSEFYVILVSSRYKMLSIIDTHPNIIMGFKDGIIAVPFVPSLWGYHKFHLVINRLNDTIPVDICFSNGIIIHDGVDVCDDNLEILQVDFRYTRGELFKYYVIKFE
jgi:hypothetical protein